MSDQFCSACNVEHARARNSINAYDWHGSRSGYARYAALLIGTIALMFTVRALPRGFAEGILELFAIVGAMFCVIFGIALILHAVPLLWETIVGQGFHAFRDRAGRLHEHRRASSRITSGPHSGEHIADAEKYDAQLTNPNAAEAYARAGAHLVAGPILKLRRGGVFRRCRIFGETHGWSVRTWAGCMITLRDYDGCVVSVHGIAAALRLLAQQRSVDDLITASENRDTLLERIAEAEAVLLRAQETIGRTKHAKVLKHLIHRMFDAIAYDGRNPGIAAIVARGLGVDDVALIREVLGPDWQPLQQRATSAQETAS